jgi:hypothetical protein
MDLPSAKLSPEERNALPENVRAYILALEAELNSLKQSLHSNDDELRRKRFAYWKR